MRFYSTKKAVTAHLLTWLNRTVRKCFEKAATFKHQYSEPGLTGKLYCCLPVAVELAFLLLREESPMKNCN